MNISNELKKIGWYPGRKIELSCWVSDIKIKLDEYNNINVPLKIRMFAENLGDLYYINEDDIWYSFLQNISKVIINASELYIIGVIHSGILGRLRLCMSKNENFYILEYNRKIADSIEEFFYRMFSDSLDISLEISEKFFETIKNAGWYPNRKVDISHFINTLRENNYIISDSVIKFYSEYYNLQGKNEDFEWKIFDENDILEYYGNYERYLRMISNSRYISKLSPFPICILESYDDRLEYYITEDEKVVDEYGTLVGNNFLEGMNSILR
ncbi:MAG: SUKH-3 domain-containing protein [Ruminococcus sp.]|nr:SUKH-3 domain-containing protein [Ruminococcus sp.]